MFEETKKLTTTDRGQGGFGSTDKQLYSMNKILKIDIRVKKGVSTLLIDSGAEGNFIGEEECKRLKLNKGKAKTAISVTLPNGKSYSIN